MKIVSLIAAALMLTLSSAFSADAVNKTCPVKGKAVDGSTTASVDVAFCCKKCKAKFDKAPASFLAKVAAAEKGKCPISGQDAGDAKSTIAVAVCCKGCKGKVEKDPKKYLAALGEKSGKKKE